QAGIGGLKGGGNFFAQMVAKDAPTRLTGEVAAERYEPLEAQRFKLERPEGWAFLKSGRTVYIRADGGRTYMPDQGAGAHPRDVVLEGHVVIKIFDPKAGGKPPNLATHVRLGIITTTVLKYD